MSIKPQQPVQLQNNDRKALAEHFEGKEFNDKLVAEFCINHKLPLTDAGSVEDFIYQKQYDERMNTVVSLVLAEVAKYKYNSEYITDQERKEIMEFNEQITINIAKILEDNGIEYRECGFLNFVAGEVNKLLASSLTRVSNMCATVLAEMAMEKLGDPLTIKHLAKERAQIADRKAKKEKTETPKEVETKE